MEEKMQMDDGFSLVDLIKILLSKIKILILVVICGGLAGAGFAVWRTVDINYYGTTVEFYINPESRDAVDGTESVTVNGINGSWNSSIMTTAVYLLNSADFAEWLMLKGADLPEEGQWVNPNNPQEVALGLDALIVEAKQYIAAADQAEEDLKTKNAEASDALSTLQQEWKKYIATTDYSGYSYTPENYEKISLILEGGSEPKKRPEELINAYQDYEGARDGVSGKKQAALTAHSDAQSARALADEKRKATLSVWAKTAKYKQASSRYSAAVSFSIPQNASASTGESASMLNFIRVNISVLNDAEFAKELLETIKTVVPNFIKAMLPPPKGYTNINCQKITRNDDIGMTNPGYTKRQAIIYGMGGAAFAGLIACVIVILVDRSNKCLRNYEVIPRNFNVPILGIIPTIEDMIPTNDKNAEVKE